ncbi:hypothetical protein KXX11_001858, partial [Aspergillus fumigatus]
APPMRLLLEVEPGRDEPPVRPPELRTERLLVSMSMKITGSLTTAHPDELPLPPLPLRPPPDPPLPPPRPPPPPRRFSRSGARNESTATTSRATRSDCGIL